MIKINKESLEAMNYNDVYFIHDDKFHFIGCLVRTEDSYFLDRRLTNKGFLINLGHLHESYLIHANSLIEAYYTYLK